MYAVGSLKILDRISIIGAAPLIMPTKTVGAYFLLISTDSFSTVSRYLETVEKLSVEINKKYAPTVLVGIMRGAAPIIDILSRIFKLPTAYIVIQSYSGKGVENKQGDLIFSREMSSIATGKDFKRVLLVDDLSDTCLLYTSPSPQDGLLSRMPSSA